MIDLKKKRTVIDIVDLEKAINKVLANEFAGLIDINELVSEINNIKRIEIER